ncbi:hypothetical protein [Natronosalvus vescus]|uniref:hypothetical protein n=1 Tax=Natronosalvus vescus TaxID=2953881 RepID=UPI0020901FE5|nr:hypothetical protein [Natronosalvus vescus]
MFPPGVYRITTLAVLLVVVLAGCAAPMADPGAETGTETSLEESTESELEIRDDLPFDADRSFERVQAMLGVTMQPPAVYIEEPLDPPGSSDRDPSSFYAVMGVPAPDPADIGPELRVGGVASSMQAVYLLPEDDATPAELEQVFVHELVHIAQFQQQAPQRIESSIPASHRGTTDATLTTTSLIEGAAVSVSSAYTTRYDLPVGTEREILERYYPKASAGTQLQWGPYHFGSQYVDAVADSPADHWQVYETPPVTMQELREGEPAITTGETTLETVDITVDDDHPEWAFDPFEDDVMGVFALERVLATELSAETATDATAGWAYDRVRRASADDDRVDSYVWAVRFEDDTSADRFEATAERYLESRSTSIETITTESNATSDGTASTEDRWFTDSYAFGLERADERTVVLVGGDRTFLESVTVEGTAWDGDVRVSLAEDDSTASMTAPSEGAVPFVAGATGVNEGIGAIGGTGAPGLTGGVP